MASLTEKSTQTAGQEYDKRRRVPRRPVSCNVGILFKGVYHIGRAYELGEGGMLISSPVALTTEARLMITFRLMGVMQGAMIAHVAYVRDSKNDKEPKVYGVQFDKVDFDLKRKIRNFVASNTGKSGDFSVPIKV